MPSATSFEAPGQSPAGPVPDKDFTRTDPFERCPAPWAAPTFQMKSAPGHAVREGRPRPILDDDKKEVSETKPPVHYEITVEGILDPRWSAWFDGLQLTSDTASRTVIAGPVADQAALHGLLARIRDLGLPLLAVRRTGQ